jgi:hypothetical protein
MRALISITLFFLVQSTHAQFKPGHYGSNSKLFKHTRNIYINTDSTFISQDSLANNIQPTWKGKWSISNDTVTLSGLISYPYTGFNFSCLTDSTIKGIKIDFKYSTGEPLPSVPTYIYCFDKEPIDTFFSNSFGVVFFPDSYLKGKTCTNTICYSIQSDGVCNQTRLSQPKVNYFKIVYEQGHPDPKQEIMLEKFLFKNNTLIPVNLLTGTNTLKEYILSFIDKSYR